VEVAAKAVMELSPVRGMKDGGWRAAMPVHCVICVARIMRAACGAAMHERG